MKLIRTLLIVLVACAPATAPAADSTEQQLSALIADWANALIKRDVAFLENVLAPEFQGIDESGSTFTRADYITRMSSADLVVKAVKVSDLKTRDYGGVTLLTLVVGGQATYKGKDDNGVSHSTLVFVKRDGRWQCVASHASAVASQPEPAQTGDRH
jgi:hypothetical protein